MSAPATVSDYGQRADGKSLITLLETIRELGTMVNAELSNVQETMRKESNTLDICFEQVRTQIIQVTEEAHDELRNYMQACDDARKLLYEAKKIFSELRKKPAPPRQKDVETHHIPHTKKMLTHEEYGKLPYQERKKYIMDNPGFRVGGSIEEEIRDHLAGNGNGQTQGS